MTIKDMHYDFKKKLNKVDSQQYKNLLVPEIDWTLNEAQELFVKMIAFPRQYSYLGFETSQRTIDDIRTLVVTPKSNPNACITVNSNVASLPADYWHYLKSFVKMDKGICKGIQGKVHIQQHDDEFESSELHNSSFEWREVNATFFEDGIQFYATDFSIKQLCMSYLKRPQYIHNAEDFRGSQYKLPSGTLLTGFQNCELPEQTHREIVDIAVLLVTGEIESPNQQFKIQKLQMNRIQ